ncbi:MAG: hypothetical protein HHJ12_17130 [Glaciimonas sp.]|nr:hypothetical protein [Glaciimonas sp.]
MLEKDLFEKLNVDHVRQLMAYLPLLEQARPELAKLMAAKPEKTAKFFESGLAWGGLYDLTIVEHLTVFSDIAGLNDFLVHAAASPDPHGEMMKLDDHPDFQEWNGGTDGQYEIQHLLGVLYSLIGTLDSLMLYGFYLNELLAKARDNSDDEALFNAIRVDPLAITSDTAAHRIARASVQADALFFSQLQNAIKGKSGKQARYLKKFKLFMQLLLEQGLLGRPNFELRALALELGTYAEDANAEKNLNELIRKFRKKKTTQ